MGSNEGLSVVAPRVLVVPTETPANTQDYALSGGLVISGGVLYVANQDGWIAVGSQTG